MLQTPFSGASGRVSFDVNPLDGMTATSNRNVSSTRLGLHNVRAVSVVADGSNSIDNQTSVFESVTVALYQRGRWERTGEDVRYHGGSTTEPLPLITVGIFCRGVFNKWALLSWPFPCF
eukprot:scaffold9806_cov145-Amphora_coffeaeformis.AAC.2